MFNRSKIKDNIVIKDNLFENNTAREATCVYIEDNKMNYSNKSSDL